MKSQTNWSSENVLFTALIVAAVGWTAVSAASAAAEQLAPKPAASCAVAHAAPAGARLAAAPAAHRGCTA